MRGAQGGSDGATRTGSAPREPLGRGQGGRPRASPELLVYRSNLLGSDKRITNYGGGNTSSKVTEQDPLTGETSRCCGSRAPAATSASIKLDGFATLYMDKLRALKGLYRGLEHEDEMVGYLPHCTFNLNPRAASIDTPLHAYVPYPHVDHMHPDAIIAIAATRNSPRALTKEIYGDAIGWLPWKRPGFELGLMAVEKFARRIPTAKGVMLESHGLFTWGDDAQGLLRDDAARSSTRRSTGSTRRPTASRSSAAQRCRALDAAERRAIAARLMPEIRGPISDGGAQGRPFRRQRRRARIRQFQATCAPLAALGTSAPTISCAPRSARWCIEFDPARPDVDAVVAGLDDAIADYRAGYAAYYERCKHPD